MHTKYSAVETVDHEELDAVPFILNCTNGTLDLFTGERRAHDAAGLCTQQCPVAYGPLLLHRSGMCAWSGGSRTPRFVSTSRGRPGQAHAVMRSSDRDTVGPLRVGRGRNASRSLSGPYSTPWAPMLSFLTRVTTKIIADGIGLDLRFPEEQTTPKGDTRVPAADAPEGVSIPNEAEHRGPF
jgi:hypothetical protein